ncbi:hypothetical protein Tco_0369619 [Tanacetum coccineum]
MITVGGEDRVGRSMEMRKREGQKQRIQEQRDEEADSSRIQEEQIYRDIRRDRDVRQWQPAESAMEREEENSGLEDQGLRHIL